MQPFSSRKLSCNFFFQDGEKSRGPRRYEAPYQTTTKAMNRFNAKLIHKRKAKGQNRHKAQRDVGPRRTIQKDVVAGGRRNQSANRPLRAPSLQISFRFKRFRQIKRPQQIKDFHLRLSGTIAFTNRANADEILLSVVDGVRFATTSKKTIAAGNKIAQFSFKNSIVSGFQRLGRWFVGSIFRSANFSET